MTRGTPMTMETSKPPLCPLGNDEVWHQKYKAVNSGSQTILQFLRHPIQTDTHRYDMIITITTVYYLYTYIYISLSLCLSQAIVAAQIAIHCPKKVCFWTKPHYSPNDLKFFIGFLEIQQHHYSICVFFQSLFPLISSASIGPKSLRLVENHLKSQQYPQQNHPYYWLTSASPTPQQNPTKSHSPRKTVVFLLRLWQEVRGPGGPGQWHLQHHPQWQVRLAQRHLHGHAARGRGGRHGVDDAAGVFHGAGEGDGLATQGCWENGKILGESWKMDGLWWIIYIYTYFNKQINKPK